MSDWTSAPRTMDDAMRLIGAGHDVEHVMDALSFVQREDFRQFLLTLGENGRIALEHYDEAMRALDNGTLTARMSWHSISAAQKRVLMALVEGRSLVRCLWNKNRFGAIGEPHAVHNLCGVATVRALAVRELVAWDGGAFDPEAKAVLTERGRFLVQHGPTPGPGAD